MVFKVKFFKEANTDAICETCRESGDIGAMIRIAAVHYHGRCFIKDFGLNALLALPLAERGKLTRDDVGKEVEKKLLDVAMDEGYGDMI